MRTGQREGLGADERRHHVEEQHEGHEAGGRQQQHLSAKRPQAGRSRALAPGVFGFAGEGGTAARGRGGAGAGRGGLRRRTGSWVRAPQRRDSAAQAPCGYRGPSRQRRGRFANGGFRISGSCFVPKSRDSTLKSEVPVRKFLEH